MAADSNAARPDDRSPRLLVRALRIALPALLGVCLLWLGMPRVMGAFALLPGDPYLEAEPGVLEAAQIEALLRSRERAARYFDAPAIGAEIGQAELYAAESAPADSPERRRHVDRAVEAFRRGLAADPRDTFAWARLAYALFLRDGVGAAAVDAWRMSILTAPSESRLVLWRAEFGAAGLRQLDRQDQQRVAQQMRYAWRSDRAGLTRMAKARGLQLVLRRVLSAEPDAAELNWWFSRPEDG